MIYIDTVMPNPVHRVSGGGKAEVTVSKLMMHAEGIFDPVHIRLYA